MPDYTKVFRRGVNPVSVEEHITMMSREDSLAWFKDHRLPEDPFDEEEIFEEQEDTAIVQGMTVPSWLRDDGYVNSSHVMPAALMSPPLLNRMVKPPTKAVYLSS